MIYKYNFFFSPLEGVEESMSYFDEVTITLCHTDYQVTITLCHTDYQVTITLCHTDYQVTIHELF
jgi:uncharacterized protein YacL (UPF0231 family)